MNSATQCSTLTRSRWILCLAALSLTACAGSEKIDITGNKTVREAVDAATGPLEDLNIKQREIPEVLKVAARNPYARPAKARCAFVKEELAKLDEALGPDLEGKLEKAGEGEFMSMANLEVEMPKTEAVQGMAMDYAKSAVLSTIRSQTDILPFRSIMRKVTGADRYQKKLTHAYEAGKLRRAYLKGYAMERFGEQCLAPEVVVEAKAETKAEN